MNLFSRLFGLFRRNRESNARRININSGNYNKRIERDYIQGDVYNFGTREESPTLPQRDKNQQDLLDYVQHVITNRLEYSLHNRVSILIDKEEAPSQVNPPWAIEVKIGSRKPYSLPPETKIIDIYDRKKIKGKLLILGAPGSGKTTTLLQLAEVLANRASQDINQPIPILLNLSSWQDDEQSIKDWIIVNLKLIYGVRKDIGQNWLESAIIIPLLDGLDELASDRQEKCVYRINQFLDSEGKLHPIVVCSRTEEYQLYQSRLDLSGSIILQPLNQEQIKDFVLRTEGEELWSNIKDDSNLMDLSKTALLLNIIVISCEEISFYNWQNLESSQQRLNYLFDAYISRMLKREYREKKPNDKKIKHWLGWLGAQLIREEQTEFFIENLQPDWPIHSYFQSDEILYFHVDPDRIQVYLTTTSMIRETAYNRKKKLIFGLIGGLSGGLFFWLLSSLLFLLTSGSISSIITMLIGGLIPGLLSGLLSGLILLQNTLNIKPIETLNLSLVNFKKKLISEIIGGITFSLNYGLIGGLIFGLISGLYHGQLKYALIFGLFSGLFSGLFLGLVYVMICVSFYGFLEMEIDVKRYPNQGIVESCKNGIFLAILFLAIIIIISILMGKIFDFFSFSEIKYLLSIVQSIGIVLAIVIPNLAAIQHLSLRLVLWSSGYAPWNYSRFLNYCTDRLFLQRVGGSYRFIHRLLQEHFAQMWKEQERIKRKRD